MELARRHSGRRAASRRRINMLAKASCSRPSSVSSGWNCSCASGLRIPRTAPTNRNRNPDWTLLPVSIERSPRISSGLCSLNTRFMRELPSSSRPVISFRLAGRWRHELAGLYDPRHPAHTSGAVRREASRRVLAAVARVTPCTRTPVDRGCRPGPLREPAEAASDELARARDGARALAFHLVAPVLATRRGPASGGAPSYSAGINGSLRADA